MELKMPKRLRIAATIAVIVAVSFFLWMSLRDGTPAGQPRLGTITATLPAFEREFDRAADEIRLIVLLSPT
jgi:hypothetical protein